MTAVRGSRPLALRRPAPNRKEPPTDYGPWPSAIALALIMAALLAVFANIFTVKHVEVIGVNLPVAQIVATADVTGKNIFRIRSDSVVARVDSMPVIEVSKVETVFPGTVKIYASLRRAYGAWRNGHAIFLVDDTGRIIGQAATPPIDLPLISGGTSAPSFAVLTAAHYAMQLLPAEPDGTLGQMQMDPKLGMEIIGKSGWQAIIGTADSQTLVKRVATLGALLRAIAAKGQGLKYADLRYREPYYRPR